MNKSNQKKQIPWLQIIPIIVSLLVFLFGTGYFYNNFINRPVLAYTLLENYDLGSQYFSGVVIENRGKQNQTNINITISNLASEIVAINFPGLHESLNITSGGVNNNSVTIEMPRLSAKKSLSVYLVSSKPIPLVDSNLLVSSSETVGQPSNELFSVINASSRVAALISIIAAGFTIWNSVSLWITTSKRKDAELKVTQGLLKVARDTHEIDKSTTDIKLETKNLQTQQDEIRGSIQYIQESLAKGADSIDRLSKILQEAIEYGKIESDDQVEKILKLLENYRKGIKNSSETLDSLAKISKGG